MPSLLLTTKLRPPRLRPDIVHRARLLQRLTAGQAQPFILVAAPAGFGKTTLLIDWLTQQPPHRTAWLALDQADNQPTQFWQSALAALAVVAPTACQEAMALLALPTPPAIPELLTLLINTVALLPDSYTLVLDDYHLIESRAVHEEVRFLIEALPSNLQLIILTRADPPFPLTRWRARGLLTEIRAHDLRFARAEIAAFFANFRTCHGGAPLSEADLAILEERTEGWAAGLQLAQLSLQGCSDVKQFIQTFGGNHKQVLDYLTSEVLEQQPPALQQFLLQTSILERLCAEVCATLIATEQGAAVEPVQPPRPSPAAITQAQATLEALANANLFVVALDEEGRWYRYHALFAALLRKRLLQTAPTAVDELYRRAALWYEQAGLIDMAIQHAFAATDRDLAIALIARHATAAWLRGDLRQLEGWLTRLPAGVLETNPALTLAKLWVNVLSRQLPDFEQALAAHPALQDGAPSPALAGEIALLRATVALFQTQYERVIDYAQLALHHFDRPSLSPREVALRAAATLNLGLAQRRQGNTAAALPLLTDAARLAQLADAPYVRMVALENLGSAHVRHGALVRAIETYRQARAIPAQPGAPIAQITGVIDIALGEIYYEQNQLERVIDLMPVAFQQLHQLLRGMEPGVTVRGYSLLARTELALGRPAAAQAAIQEAELFLARLPQPNPAISALWAVHKTRLWLQQGDLLVAHTEATGWCVAERTELACFQQLTLARLRIAQLQQQASPAWVTEATQLLAAALATAVQNTWVSQQIEGLVLQALLQQVTQQTAQAVTTLRQALTLAQPATYIRTFVDLGEPVAALVRQVQAQGTLTAYCQQLLAAIPVPTAPILPPAASVHHADLIEALSPREMEVLRLLALGKTNQEIADTLIIALGTVKSHTNSLFGKLGVASRTQAIARSHDLGLL